MYYLEALERAANHNGSSAHDRRGAQRRLRAPQPLLEALERAVAMQITMAVAHTTAGGPSGDSARRSPFCSLIRSPFCSLWMTGSGSVSE